MNNPNRRIMIILSLFVVGIMVLAVGMSFFSDGHKLLEAVHNIHAEQMLFALLCTGTAYLAFTLSFNALFEMTPYRIPFNRFFSIMFISYTINFIVSTGGWAGVAIRSYLLRFEKVPYSVTVPISFAQNMVFNLVLSGVCFGGLIYLREHPKFIGEGREGIVFAFMIGLVALVAIMLLIFFRAGFRKWFLRLMIKIGSWLGRVFLRKQSSHQR
ncbi:MAG TPA: lysylphosphatidylglycerol synthase transmembrane domain-containing protein, partial [bacterium]|nr:lysylphosphatidylglycerol synthase transmembrane domain-containing protein [bacterium]